MYNTYGNFSLYTAQPYCIVTSRFSEQTMLIGHSNVPIGVGHIG